MSRIHVEAERVVDARPEKVYETLTDYKEKRPKMLTSNFVDYNVEKGGRGLGTVVNYRLHAAGRERPYRIKVDVPFEGSVITERDSNSSLVTTWTLAPVQEGRQTRVSVESEWEGGRGVGGFFERTFAPLGLRRIYGNMLERLEYQVQPGGVRSADEQAGIRPGLVVLAAGAVVALAIGIGYIRGKK